MSFTYCEINDLDVRIIKTTNIKLGNATVVIHITTTFLCMYNKMKTKNYHTTPFEQFQNIIEQWYRETKSILLTHKYMTACIPGFGTDTSIKSGRVKLVLWVQTSCLSERIYI